MKAPDSSSSATSRLDLDLIAAGRLASLPTRFLLGENRDLLSPLRWNEPGSLPAGPVVTPTLGAAGRAKLAAALAESNERYGHPHAAALAAKLADPATAVIVSGQQPGLWGGPLLAAVKALAAARYAKGLEAAGRKAVAVFWVATEDHDWAEASHALLPGRQGPQPIALGEDPRPLLPLADRVWGEGITAADQEALALLGGGPAFERWQAELSPLFTAEAAVGESFCRFFVKVLGDNAPLLLDATLPALKEAERPFLRRLIEKRHELDAAYAAAEERVTTRGFELQVRPQRGVSPLFLVRGGERRRIEFPGEQTWALRGVAGSEAPIADLLRLLDEEPACFSPGVLARPAIQDAVLGTTLQVMGPAETSYLSQASAAYDILGIEAPYTTLRPQVLLLEDRQVGWLDELELPLAELLSQPLEKILTSRFGGNPVDEVRRQVVAGLDTLFDPLLALDASLETPWRKSREQIDRTLEQLETKAAAAAARRHEVQLRRLEQLKQVILPQDKLQERVVTTGYFYARFGERLAAAIFHEMKLDGRHLSVIRLAAQNG